MEHGAINSIENIIICGEDETEDLLVAVSEAYPDAKVSFQEIESMEIEGVIHSAQNPLLLFLQLLPKNILPSSIKNLRE